MGRTQSRPLVGVHYFATDRSLPITDFARAAAERGFDAVLLPEHTHIPLTTESPYPGGGDLPERYSRTFDPYVALSVVAAQTGLKIGTCISLVAQHDPIALAKTIATLDFVSGGRFSLGVGYGWNVPEVANHGHEAAKRRAIVREYVALMRALWQDTEAEFRGAHANLSPSWAWPKPVQRPSVPVLLGCSPTPRGATRGRRAAARLHPISTSCAPSTSTPTTSSTAFCIRCASAATISAISISAQP